MLGQGHGSVSGWNATLWSWAVSAQRIEHLSVIQKNTPFCPEALHSMSAVALTMPGISSAPSFQVTFGFL